MTSVAAALADDGIPPVPPTGVEGGVEASRLAWTEYARRVVWYNTERVGSLIASLDARHGDADLVAASKRDSDDDAAESYGKKMGSPFAIRRLARGLANAMRSSDEVTANALDTAAKDPSDKAVTTAINTALLPAAPRRGGEWFRARASRDLAALGKPAEKRQRRDLVDLTGDSDAIGLTSAIDSTGAIDLTDVADFNPTDVVGVPHRPLPTPLRLAIVETATAAAVALVCSAEATAEADALASLTAATELRHRTDRQLRGQTFATAIRSRLGDDAEIAAALVTFEARVVADLADVAAFRALVRYVARAIFAGVDADAAIREAEELARVIPSFFPTFAIFAFAVAAARVDGVATSLATRAALSDLVDGDPSEGAVRAAVLPLLSNAGVSTRRFVAVAAAIRAVRAVVAAHPALSGAVPPAFLVVGTYDDVAVRAEFWARGLPESPSDRAGSRAREWRRRSYVAAAAVRRAADSPTRSRRSRGEYDELAVRLATYSIEVELFLLSDFASPTCTQAWPGVPPDEIGDDPDAKADADRARVAIARLRASDYGGFDDDAVDAELGDDDELRSDVRTTLLKCVGDFQGRKETGLKPLVDVATTPRTRWSSAARAVLCAWLCQADSDSGKWAEVTRLADSLLGSEPELEIVDEALSEYYDAVATGLIPNDKDRVFETPIPDVAADGGRIAFLEATRVAIVDAARGAPTRLRLRRAGERFRATYARNVALMAAFDFAPSVVGYDPTTRDPSDPRETARVAVKEAAARERGAAVARVVAEVPRLPGAIRARVVGVAVGSVDPPPRDVAGLPLKELKSILDKTDRANAAIRALPLHAASTLRLNAALATFDSTIFVELARAIKAASDAANSVEIVGVGTDARARLTREFEALADSSTRSGVAHAIRVARGVVFEERLWIAADKISQALMVRELVAIRARVRRTRTVWTAQYDAKGRPYWSRPGYASVWAINTTVPTTSPIAVTSADPAVAAVFARIPESIRPPLDSSSPASLYAAVVRTCAGVLRLGATPTSADLHRALLDFDVSEKLHEARVAPQSRFGGTWIGFHPTADGGVYALLPRMEQSLNVSERHGLADYLRDKRGITLAATTALEPFLELPPPTQTTLAGAVSLERYRGSDVVATSPVAPIVVVSRATAILDVAVALVARRFAIHRYARTNGEAAAEIRFALPYAVAYVGVRELAAALDASDMTVDDAIATKKLVETAVGGTPGRSTLAVARELEAPSRTCPPWRHELMTYFAGFLHARRLALLRWRSGSTHVGQYDSRDVADAREILQFIAYPRSPTQIYDVLVRSGFAMDRTLAFDVVDAYVQAAASMCDVDVFPPRDARPDLADLANLLAANRRARRAYLWTDRDTTLFVISDDEKPITRFKTTRDALYRALVAENVDAGRVARMTATTKAAAEWFLRQRPRSVDVG